MIRAYKRFVADLAKASGEVIMPYFGNLHLKVDWKADASPVTEADREAERVMREMISGLYPEHGIIGEEYGEKNPEAEFVWVLDPIDGTKSFTAGTPQFGTLIALLHHKTPILGAIHHPVSRQLLIGDGMETRLNGEAVHCRSTRSLKEAVLLCTDLDTPAEYRDGAGWERLRGAVRKTYTWGDCHAYFLLATGGADIACDPIMNLWDIAALIPVVRGAGGVVSSWQGADAVGADSMIAAATPELHQALLNTLHRKGCAD
jgi:histidinol phosphatase-like enzyme (inositol monophosphatase family)